jgi:hypothetical protein
MTITFENDNDVIVYGLEKVISYARRTQQIFVAQCVWWLASIIGLESNLIAYIDKLRKQEELVPEEPKELIEGSEQPQGRQEPAKSDPRSAEVHPDRVGQITNIREVSATPRDLAEDQRFDQLLDKADLYITESVQARNTWSRKNRINPLPQTKAQLKKARKTKRLQEARDKVERERQERIRQLRDQVIEKLTSDGLV